MMTKRIRFTLLIVLLLGLLSPQLLAEVRVFDKQTIEVFGDNFTGDAVERNWLGARSGEFSLAGLGVQNYGLIDFELAQPGYLKLFKQVQKKLKKKTVKKQFPVTINFYLDSYAVDGSLRHFDINNVLAISIYTISDFNQGVYTHTFYDLKNKVYQHIPELQTRMLDDPECAIAAQTGLYWLNDEYAPSELTLVKFINQDLMDHEWNGLEREDGKKLLDKIKTFKGKGIKCKANCERSQR